MGELSETFSVESNVIRSTEVGWVQKGYQDNKQILLLVPTGALYIIMPRVCWSSNFLRFSLSPMPQCHNTCFKSLLRDQCYSGRYGSTDTMHQTHTTNKQMFKCKNPTHIAVEVPKTLQNIKA